MRLQPLILLTLLVLHASTALAEEQGSNTDPESEALALEAHQVLSEHCAEAAGGAATAAAESVALVSDVWARVSAQVEVSKKVYLLYWRGVLGQCLSQEERALEDLQMFVQVRKGSELWAGLVADAEKRISRLNRRLGSSGGPSGDPGKAVATILGAGLAAGAVASAVGAALKWQEALDHAENLYPQKLSGTAFEAAHAQGQTLSDTTAALAAVSVGCGIGSALSFAILASQSSSGSSATLGPPLILPTPTGAAVLWEGRW